MALLYVGDAAGAVAPLERGLRLNPFDPQNFHWFRSLSLAYYFTGDPGKGLQAAGKAPQVRPTWRPAVGAATICHLALGRLEDARRCAEQLRQLEKPESDVLEQLRLRNPHWARNIAAALEAAGAHTASPFRVKLRLNLTITALLLLSRSRTSAVESSSEYRSVAWDAPKTGATRSD